MIRLSCALALMLLSTSIASAQPDRPPVPTHAHPVIQGIQKHINGLCTAHQERLAAIKTEAELIAERDRTRAAFLKLLDLPLDAKRDPPAALPVGKVDFEEYTILKVLLGDADGVQIPCNVYVPKGGPARKPAILSPHGHGGRDWPHYQNAYQRFAKAGFIVLAKDGWGRQERRGTGHEAEGGQLFLSGGSLMALELWDNVRCIDYLLTRRDVDPEKIGMAGTSGGGSQTLYAAAADPRIKAASPTCAVTSFQADLADTNMCVCEVNADLLSIGDHGTFLAMAYPRQWLVVNGTADYIFPIQGARASVAEAKRLYGLGQKPERDGELKSLGLELAEFPVGHAWNDEMLDAQIRFFRRAFDLPPLEKLPTGGAFVPYDLLRCTAEGDFGDRTTIAKVNAERMQRLQKEQQPRTAEQDVAAWKERLAGLWSGEPKLPAAIDSRDLPPDKQRFFLSRRLSWPSGLGGEVSAVVTRPAHEAQQAKARKMVFVRFTSESLDRVSQFYWNDLVKTEATAVEFSYTGSDLSPQKEGESSMALLTAGRSLLAERARDLAVLLLVLEKEQILEAKTELVIVARGNDAQLLLLAACLTPPRATLVLDTMPVSYRVGPGIVYPDQSRAETSHWTVVPRLAARHDLLDFVERSGPRRLVVFHPLDNAWQPLDEKQIHDKFSRLPGGHDRILIFGKESPRSTLSASFRDLIDGDLE